MQEYQLPRQLHNDPLDFHLPFHSEAARQLQVSSFLDIHGNLP